MPSCQTHGAVPWTRYGCSLCLALTIPDVPQIPPAPAPSGPGAIERFQNGFAKFVWSVGVFALVFIGVGGVLFLTAAGKGFDVVVLAAIRKLGQFDSPGFVTGAMWWIYLFLFIVLPASVLVAFSAWMLFWSNPKTRKAFWRLIGLAK